jgi:hypothetical protein
MYRTLIAVALVALAGAAAAQPKDGVPVPGPALGGAKAPPASKAAPFKTITWDELVPKDWDPMAAFKGMDLGMLQDGDPRAVEMMKKLREVWDNAPTNPTLVGQPVRIPGFVVPLEESKDGVKEFLLVPYFGACIHSPPPPANQIIHVLPKSPAKSVKSMDAVWITGTLATLKTDSYMGASSYRIEATGVEPYAERPR